MSRIRRLPDHLVNKIAAGEVVERPASVVKELVENAIDAGARAVTVELKDAGRQLIRVTDDGIGMTAEEVDLALLRHATSKLETDADLEAIATLGFRGEALPAICAVTRFAVRSSPRGDASGTGTLVRGEGGVVGEKLLVDTPAGTTVEAQDLFFNTPGRLKFLKTAPTELAAALRLLEGIALAHPDIHFRVTHNGKAVLTAPRARGPARSARRAPGIRSRRADARRRSAGGRRDRDRPRRPAAARARQSRRDHGHRQRPAGARHAPRCRR